VARGELFVNPFFCSLPNKNTKTLKTKENIFKVFSLAGVFPMVWGDSFSA
jgi:hypothetical protein